MHGVAVVQPEARFQVFARTVVDMAGGGAIEGQARVGEIKRSPLRPEVQPVADVFPDDVHFAVAYHQDQPIACGCGFLWNGEFEITWASALRSHKAMSPNMLVYWELMDRMVGAGARLFNFGRCTKDSGTYRFKMQWGGREEPLWWYQRARNANGTGEASTPSPDHGVFALATRVWQRLPVPVASTIGPRVVRFIP